MWAVAAVCPLCVAHRLLRKKHTYSTAGFSEEGGKGRNPRVGEPGILGQEGSLAVPSVTLAIWNSNPLKASGWKLSPTHDGMRARTFSILLEI